MSTQDPLYLENTDYVEISTGVNCAIQVLSGSVAFRADTAKPEINLNPLPDGRRWLGHAASANSMHNHFHYGVPSPANVYAIATSANAVIVVTEY